MAVTIPGWLLGKHLTVINIIPLTVNSSTDVVTAGTSGSLTGVVDYVRLSAPMQTTMIAPVDAEHAHYERELYDYALVLGEILRRKISGREPIIPAIAATYDRARIQFTRGGQSWSMNALLTDYNDGVQAYGKNSVELSARPIVTIDSGTGIVPPVTFTNGALP